MQSSLYCSRVGAHRSSRVSKIYAYYYAIHLQCIWHCTGWKWTKCMCTSNIWMHIGVHTICFIPFSRHNWLFELFHNGTKLLSYLKFPRRFFSKWKSRISMYKKAWNHSQSKKIYQNMLWKLWINFTFISIILFVKFMFYKKATKMDEISTLDLTFAT